MESEAVRSEPGLVTLFLHSFKGKTNVTMRCVLMRCVSDCLPGSGTGDTSLAPTSGLSPAELLSFLGAGLPAAARLANSSLTGAAEDISAGTDPFYRQMYQDK